MNLNNISSARLSGRKKEISQLAREDSNDRSDSGVDLAITQIRVAEKIGLSGATSERALDEKLNQLNGPHLSHWRMRTI